MRSSPRSLPLLGLALLLLLPAGRAKADQPRHRYAVSLGPAVGQVLRWGVTTAGSALEVSGGTNTEIALRLDLHPLVSGQPGLIFGSVQGVLRRFLRRWRRGEQPGADPYLGLGIGTNLGTACTYEHACGGFVPRMDAEVGLRLGLAEHWDLQASVRLGLQGGTPGGIQEAVISTLGLVLRWKSRPRASNAR